MRYRLIAEDGRSGMERFSTTVVLEEPTLTEMLDAVGHFIRSAGYVIEGNARLEFVQENEVIMNQDEYLALVEQAENGELAPLDRQADEYELYKDGDSLTEEEEKDLADGIRNAEKRNTEMDN
jgi:hypothetical protein